MEKIKKTPLTGESPAQSKTNNFIWNLKVKQGGQPKKQQQQKKPHRPQIQPSSTITTSSLRLQAAVDSFSVEEHEM